MDTLWKYASPRLSRILMAYVLGGTVVDTLISKRPDEEPLLAVVCPKVTVDILVRL